MRNFKLLIVIMGLTLPLASKAQKTYINANGYSVIEAIGMPRDAYEVRAPNFAPGGRVPRHDLSLDPTPNTPNYLVSAKFAISPPLKTSANKPMELSWAEAAGWHINANGTPYNIEPPNEPAETGCPSYKGMSEMNEAGTWRLPTQREAKLIFVFLSVLAKNPAFDYNATAVQTWKYHWTATEGSDNASVDIKQTNAISIKLIIPGGEGTQGGDTAPMSKKNVGFVRCVKDLP